MPGYDYATRRYIINNRYRRGPSQGAGEVTATLARTDETPAPRQPHAISLKSHCVLIKG